MTAAQIEYVESLEKITRSLSNNGAVKFMAALNKKMEAVAEQLDGMSIDINMSDKDDKTLDRLLKMADLGGSFVNAFKTFNQEYGITEKEDEQKSVPLAEKLARKNRDNGNKSN